VFNYSFPILLVFIVFTIFFLDSVEVSGPTTKKITCVDSTLVQRAEYECYASETVYGVPFKSKAVYEILTNYTNSSGQTSLVPTGYRLTAEYGARDIKYYAAGYSNTQQGGIIVSPNIMALLSIYAATFGTIKLVQYIKK